MRINIRGSDVCHFRTADGGNPLVNPMKKIRHDSTCSMNLGGHEARSSP